MKFYAENPFKKANIYVSSIGHLIKYHVPYSFLIIIIFKCIIFWILWPLFPRLTQHWCFKQVRNLHKLQTYFVGKILPQNIEHLPWELFSMCIAWISSKQFDSTYSTNTNNNFKAVFTTKRNFEETREYSHWIVGLCSITPFIPSTYSITCPKAIYQKAKPKRKKKCIN